MLNPMSKERKMPQYEHRRQFAWRPVLTASGKWIWWRHYVKLMKIYWGPAGEPPVVDAEFYTEGEWLLETIKNDYSNKKPLPPKFAKSAISNASNK